MNKKSRGFIELDAESRTMMNLATIALFLGTFSRLRLDPGNEASLNWVSTVGQAGTLQ